LHVGPRQLRRLFVTHLGAPPIAVAQTRRLHFAKKLIDETKLPMSDIAFGAGYSSIRRFNDSIRSVYDRSPTELRRAKKQELSNGADSIQLKLSYRPPFDWLFLMQYLQARAIPGVESVRNKRYRRVVQTKNAAGIIEVRFVEGSHHLLLNVPPVLSKDLLQISERVRTLFDLRADPTIITGDLKRDEQMAKLIQYYPGLRVPGAWDGFELAVRAILGQQISIKAANTLAGRLVKIYGDPLPAAGNDDLAYLFPGPERLAEATLANMGLMPRRAEAIRTLARAISDGNLFFDTAIGLEKSVEQLTNLPGIGPWTAHYIAMRALSEPDAFPAGDLALRRAAIGSKTTTLTESQLRQRAEVWRPWRAYAAIYLWRHYATF
jgi:AraC family transcriptional regulator of adaptative response / DNA-3-methyladenine glycosylase II